MLRHSLSNAAGIVILLMVGMLPCNLSAQQYKILDVGRIKHYLQYALYGNHSSARQTDWLANPNAMRFYYPQDEWNSAVLAWWEPDQAIEQVQQYEDATPQVQVRGWNPEQEYRRFEKQVRHRLPLVYLGLDEQLSTGTVDVIIDNNLETEQKLVLEKTHIYGKSWTVSIWGMANRDFDRTLLHNWHLEYNGIQTEHGGANKDQIIMLPPGQVQTQWHGQELVIENARSVLTRAGSPFMPELTLRRDDWVNWMAAPSQLLTSGDAARAANIVTIYKWDGWARDITDWGGSALDDTGDPRVGPQFVNNTDEETGELISDKIFGASVVHFDKNGNDPTDFFHASDQTMTTPSSCFTWRRGDQWDGGTWWSMITTPNLEINMYQQQLENGGLTQANIASLPMIPEETVYGAASMMFYCGPFVMSPGDDHDYIFSFSIADLPRRESMDIGKRYLKWIAQQKPGMHPKGSTLDASLIPLSDYEKFMILYGIRDTLQHQVDAGLYAFHGGRNSGLTMAQKKSGAGMQRMPDPPPAPDIFVKEGPGRVEIRAWYPSAGMFDDPGTGTDDFAGWQIYRKTGKPYPLDPDELAQFGYQDWQLVGTVTTGGATNAAGQLISGISPLSADHYNADYEFKDGITRRVLAFFDLDVSIGTDYYYAVTGFDDGTLNTTGISSGSLESSRFLNASLGAAVSPFTAGLDVSDQVVVAPNPWSLDLGAGLFSGIDRNKILFDKLPKQCTLKVYGETGDHIVTIEHTNGSAQEVWFQQTKYTQLVKSGVYILAVLDAKIIDINGNVTSSLPDQFVKFVIIR